MIFHDHNYIFNNDGYQVCTLCGVCTSLQDMRSVDIKPDNISKTSTNFSYILYNNHIGYIEEIDQEYRVLKKKLKRGYSNLVIYAYCVYNTLLKNKVYYSLHQISIMFRIKDFIKQYCQIEKNPLIKNSHCDIKHDVFVHSSINLFLSQLYLTSYFDKTVKISNFLKEKCPEINAKYHSSISLYLSLKTVVKCEKTLFENLSMFYQLNKRTFYKKNKIIEKMYSNQKG